MNLYPVNVAARASNRVVLLCFLIIFFLVRFLWFCSRGETLMRCRF